MAKRTVHKDEGSGLDPRLLGPPTPADPPEVKRSEPPQKLTLTDDRLPQTTQLQFFSPPELPFKLAPGVHLLCAGTGGGKTWNALSLRVYLAALGVKSRYISMYEPRTPVPTPEAPFTDFIEPPDFLASLKAMAPESEKGLFLVCDSISLAIEAWTGPTDKGVGGTRFLGSGTKPGGWSMKDLSFITEANRLAVARNYLVLACVNTDQVSYTRMLYGVCEGLWVTNGVGTVIVNSRSTGRLEVPIYIPEEHVQAAGVLLGYVDSTQPNRNKTGVRTPLTYS